jgi:hypothetical protein
MSLNFTLDTIANYKEVCWIGEGDEARMNPVTEALIFGTMSVGLGSITDKNVDEFAARFRVIEKIHGAMLYKPDPENEGQIIDWYLSDEDFTAHIGLACNVTNETRSKWAQRIFNNKQTSYTEELARNFRRNRDKEKV